MKRHLIVLMGLDGSGKTSQANLLADWLAGQGLSAEVVWMRGESYLTRPLLKIAKALLRAPKAKKRGEADTPESYRRYVDRKHSVLRSGFARTVWRILVLLDFYITFRLAFAKLARTASVVILDRYVYDSLIDVASGSGGGAAEAERLLDSRLTGIFPRPDMVILLDLEPAEAFRRKDDIPSLEYLIERHVLYRMIADRVGASVIDASKTIEEVRSAVVNSVEPWVSSLSPEKRGREGAAL
jgi:dTMP kinase